MIQVLSSNGNEYPAQCVMCNTEFVQKLAFAYRNCPLSPETTKHFQAYINSLLWPCIENFPKCAVYDIVDGLILISAQKNKRKYQYKSIKYVINSTFSHKKTADYWRGLFRRSRWRRSARPRPVVRDGRTSPTRSERSCFCAGCSAAVSQSALDPT